MTLVRVPFARKRKPTTDAYAAALDLITPALMDRADYRCELEHPEACLGLNHRPWILTRHHRKSRRHPHTNTMANVRILCGDGTTGCHGYIESHPAESYQRGWLVHSWDHPESITFESWRDDG